MPTVGRPLQSVVTFVAVAAVLVLAWATRTTASAAAQVGVGASSTCPPPLTLRVAAGNDATRAGKTVHIRATLRNHAAALPDMSMKIALPAGMCPIKTWTAPALKPRRRATLEGTASGGVNVYWSTFGLKAGGGRRFYVKTTVSANLTGPATLPVEALAWIGSDGQCLVAAQPLGVSQSMDDTSMQWCWAIDPRPHTPPNTCLQVHVRSSKGLADKTAKCFHRIPFPPPPQPNASFSVVGINQRCLEGQLVPGRRSRALIDSPEAQACYVRCSNAGYLTPFHFSVTSGGAGCWCCGQICTLIADPGVTVGK